MDGFDKFLQGYITCALWSSTGDDDNPLDRDYGPDDIAPEALERMTADCQKFYDMFANEIDAGPLNLNRLDCSGAEYAGHDFWLTRNGHGAGFWDGDWPESVGERLTAACGWQTEFPECNLYLGDDGLIYCSQG